MIGKPEEILKSIFGYDSFREGQETLIKSTLQGRDCLGIMPTGAGKSVCFQVPALLFFRNHTGDFTVDLSDERPGDFSE